MPSHFTAQQPVSPPTYGGGTCNRGKENTVPTSLASEYKHASQLVYGAACEELCLYVLPILFFSSFAERKKMAPVLL